MRKISLLHHLHCLVFTLWFCSFSSSAIDGAPNLFALGTHSLKILHLGDNLTWFRECISITNREVCKILLRSVFFMISFFYLFPLISFISFLLNVIYCPSAYAVGSNKKYSVISCLCHVLHPLTQHAVVGPWGPKINLPLTHRECCRAGPLFSTLGSGVGEQSVLMIETFFSFCGSRYQNMMWCAVGRLKVSFLLFNFFLKLFSCLIMVNKLAITGGRYTVRDRTLSSSRNQADR